MKHFISLILIAALLLCCASALAEVPELKENMFKYAKNTLACLASGDYDRIVTSVPFSDLSPSADEWRDLAEYGFRDLSGSAPQKKYAVAYWTGRVWEIAVPVSEPSDSDVEVLVLISEDGRSFTGYACTDWGSVEDEYHDADYVQWNDEYNGSTSVVIEFDED